MNNEQLLLERQKQLLRESKLLQFHQYVFELLQTSAKVQLLNTAKERTKLWQQNSLCSTFYINYWNRLLIDDLTLFEQEILLNVSNNASALMQNSPFSFLLKQFESALER